MTSRSPYLLRRMSSPFHKPFPGNFCSAFPIASASHTSLTFLNQIAFSLLYFFPTVSSSVICQSWTFFYLLSQVFPSLVPSLSLHLPPPCPNGSPPPGSATSARNFLFQISITTATHALIPQSSPTPHTVFPMTSSPSIPILPCDLIFRGVTIR